MAVGRRRPRPRWTAAAAARKPEQQQQQPVVPAPQLDQQLAASAQAHSVSNAGGLSFEPLVDAGGPPRVVSLLGPAAGAASPNQPPRAELPLLLYLPGIDGTGLAASRQFPSLQRSFDLRVLVTPVDDRTPFDRLVSLVADFLVEEVPASPPERPCYVLGESFGGVLALAVAAACPGLVDRLVLVNPATSFPRTVWPLLGPAIAGVPEQVYGALPLALAPVLGNPVGLLAAGLDDADAAGGGGAESEAAGRSGGPLQRRAAALAATAVNLLTQLPALAKVLPPDTLAWKVELLRQGCAAVDELVLAAVSQRTLILAAGADLLIPSEEEGKRLRRTLPRATLRVLPGRSHALLQEGGVNLASLLGEEGFYVRRRRMSAPVRERSARSAGFGSAQPVELPSERELEKYSQRVTAIGRALASPVFVSTAADGSRALGLGNIPDDRPILFVGNHQTLALDLGILCEQMLRERGTLLRGLAHPVIFASSFGPSAEASSSGLEGAEEEGGSAGSDVAAGSAGVGTNGSGTSGDGVSLLPWDTLPAFGRGLQALSDGRGPAEALAAMLPGSAMQPSAAGRPTDGRSSFRELMAEFGAVPVSPSSFYRLMRNGEAVLLFPGGVREAYKQRGEEYQLFWPSRPEFVRMAARFGATIVPFAAVGLDDGLTMVADRSELQRLPIVGQRLAESSVDLPAARRGVNESDEVDESFVAPLMVPKLPPNRLYFLFQQPIRTTPQDAKDRARCEELYREVRASVEGGIAWLLERRGCDPYASFTARALRERLYPDQQAPTFPLD